MMKTVVTTLPIERSGSATMLCPTVHPPASDADALTTTPLAKSSSAAFARQCSTGPIPGLNADPAFGVLVQRCIVG